MCRMLVVKFQETATQSLQDPYFRVFLRVYCILLLTLRLFLSRWQHDVKKLVIFMYLNSASQEQSDFTSAGKEKFLHLWFEMGRCEEYAHLHVLVFLSVLR